MKNLLGDTLGSVPFKEFLDWLESFMVYGSDQKVWRCGSGAYQAIVGLGEKEVNGFRMRKGADRQPPSDFEPANFQTPFGMALVQHDGNLENGEVVIKDMGVPNHPRILNSAESWADRLLTIEI